MCSVHNRFDSLENESIEINEISEKVKICKECNIEKNENEFYANRRKCKECYKKRLVC